jgi:membrane fusion protein (multidrug efflux system)
MYSNAHLLWLPACFLVASVAGCSDSAPPPQTPVEVTTLRLVPRPATVTLEYVGRTEAFNTVEIRPRTGGLLQKQVALEGDLVHAGQLLFKIDPQPYVDALAQAKAATAQAEAALEQALRDQARIAPLSKMDAASQQELDAVVARVAAGRAAVDSARAAQNTARLNLGYTDITSPITGVMGRAQVRVGALVTAYQTLLTSIYDTDPMYVNYSISEQRLLELQRVLGHSIDSSAKHAPPFHIVLADGSVYPHPGKLDFVDAAVDPRTGTLPVRLTVPNPERLLRAGQFARVVVDAETLKDALLLPQRAVQELQGNTYVWIAAADHHVERRDVLMGSRVGDEWLVVRGLSAGDEVVVDGAQKLRDGSLIRTVPPAAAAKAS